MMVLKFGKGKVLVLGAGPQDAVERIFKGH